MKHVFLFSTRVYLFLIELPLILMLTLSIIFNGRADGFLKLYPLIVTLSVAIVIIFLYFFRGIRIKFDEIRDVGLFSERDRVVINKGKTLILTKLNRGKLKVELFGCDGKAGLDWLKDEEPKEIYLYRGKAIGKDRAIFRILKFFAVDSEDLARITEEDGFDKSYEFVTVKSKITEESTEIRIMIDETV